MRSTDSLYKGMSDYFIAPSMVKTLAVVFLHLAPLHGHWGLLGYVLYSLKWTASIMCRKLFSVAVDFPHSAGLAIAASSKLMELAA